MIKKTIKDFSRSEIVRRAIAWLAAKFMTIIFKTNKWEYLNLDNVEPYWHNNRPVLMCCWHNRLCMMTYAWRSQMPFHVLISEHSDGQIISAAISHHGMQTISGSSSKGGANAIRKILRVIKQGDSIGITPDGPRGPRFSVDQGMINLAHKAGIDIVPLSFSTSRRRVLNSWDRFVLPLPFGKGVFAYGEPIRMDQIQTEEDLIKTKDLLRQRLIDISNETDRLCGNEYIPEIDLEKRSSANA